MTDYSDIIFPLDFAMDVKPGEEMPNNDIVTRINRRYPVPLRSVPFQTIEVSYGPKSQTQLNVIRKLFWAMNGTEHTFRFRNPQDYNSLDSEIGVSITNLDQNIGTGNGVTAAFQMRKSMTVGSAVKLRTITNIIPLSEVVAVAGAAKTRTTHYTIDNVTGIITFTGGNIPTAAQAVTAGFQFYQKVRFADSQLLQQFESHNRATINSFQLELAD